LSFLLLFPTRKPHLFLYLLPEKASPTGVTVCPVFPESVNAAVVEVGSAILFPQSANLGLSKVLIAVPISVTV
jgi:hypothetical protein